MSFTTLRPGHDVTDIKMQIATI